MKKILLVVLTIIVIGLTYFVYDMSDYASVVAEDGKMGLYTKWNYSELKNGDIIFHTSKSSQSKAIQLATKSKYSHMGIIYKQNDSFFVFEAVQPVKLTPLDKWIKRGIDYHFIVKRLKERDKYLTETNLNIMFQTGDKFEGRDYDIYFNWSDDKLYCSELVYKIYHAIGIDIGDLEKLKDFDLSAEIVKNKLIERYGENIPFEEIVISPVSMFNSELLETVVEN